MARGSHNSMYSMYATNFEDEDEPEPGIRLKMITKCIVAESGRES